MKKIIAGILSIMLMSSCFAESAAKLNIRISGPAKSNPYYLCLYGIGCLSIKAGMQGKTFGISTFDMGNIIKVVITDSRTMKMYTQTSPASCNVTVDNGHSLTITGKLIVKQSKPYISGLRCSVV